MDKAYTIYKCQECGCEFIIPREWVDYREHYLTCPRHGRHHQIKVIGAFDDITGCMRHRKYRRNSRGAIEQDD